MVRISRTLVLTLILAACSGGDVSSTKTRADPAPASVTFATANFDPNAIAKKLFGVEKRGSEQSPAAYGSYAKGCLAGGVQLPETGPTWQAMRLSRNRNWAHPAMIAYLQRLSQAAAKLPGWNGIYVGDMSQPRGGPMLSGHASHQIGLDADIWLLPANKLNLSTTDRENISSVSLRRAKGAYTNDKWTRADHDLLKAAASDPAVARIFIFPGAKVRMCNDETGDRTWLRKIRPWYGHHYHFHVRMTCPPGVAGCKNQNPPPAGDGCADAQKWVDNILSPPPPDPNAPKPKPRRDIVLADLPKQCAQVLSSR